MFDGVTLADGFVMRLLSTLQDCIISFFLDTEHNKNKAACKQIYLLSSLMCTGVVVSLLIVRKVSIWSVLDVERILMCVSFIFYGIHDFWCNIFFSTITTNSYNSDFVFLCFFFIVFSNFVHFSFLPFQMVLGLKKRSASPILAMI